jgi:hypothetical protein
MSDASKPQYRRALVLGMVFGGLRENLFRLTERGECFE